MFDERKPRAIDLIPTAEQIKEITNIDDLAAMKDEVMASITQMEVDLEFKVDGDSDWESRARKALTHYKIANSRLGNRVQQLKGMKGPSNEEAAEAKREKGRKKVEALAALKAHQKEMAPIQLAKEREKTKRAFLTYADRQNFLACFHRAAVDCLDSEVVDRLQEAANAILAERFENDA